ncbi:MAG TPA: Ig-like domain-containing protein [Pyrinomonadaceae bacterium]|nr:Ig-like domain-containing protein [Pyrinomonadaceae bacterium]
MQSTPSAISVRWVDNSVEVTGLTKPTLARLSSPKWKLADWQRLLRVQVESAQGSLPAMLGTYRVEGSAIRFEPQYPLAPGLSYRAIFRPAELPAFKGNRRELTAVVRVPARSLTPTTVVTQVYPTADVLPENLLKFYVHFSAPMSRGHIYDYIRLIEVGGKQVELPFLEIDEELWDDTMTRLTIFIDPGRIKRGVLPLEDVGPALETGKRYSLVIDSAWKDGAGSPLKESFQKPFLVGAPDREPPDPSQWNVQLPASGTQNRLVVLFPEPMDNAVTRRAIHVVDASGKTVAGQIELTDRERRWSFQPVGSWKRGQHQLIVQTTIEDLAGNNIGKPFDVDLFEGVQRRLTTATVKLPLPIQ